MTTTGPDWLDQAQRLVEALRGGFPGAPVDGAPADGAPADGAPADGAPADGDRHPPDCRWCPVCQAASVLRGERPEVTAALADVLTAAATALRAASAGGTDGPAPQTGADRPRSQPPPPVQQIELA